MRITTVENLVIPTGEYIANVMEISHEQGNFGPQFRWKFEVADPEEFSGKMLTGWTSASPSLKSKFIKWASACLGRTIISGEDIDTDDLAGSKVVVVITARESDDGGEFNKVEGLKVHRRQKTPTLPSVTRSNDDVDDPFGHE